MIKKIKLQKFDKIFLVYLIVILTFSISTFSLTSLTPDEGTHLLLSLFYRNLVGNIIDTGDFSFSHIYDFGINYLIHYPKLQIAYPPVYHITNGLIFYSIFGINEVAGRLCSLFYGILTFIVFYLIIKKHSNAKTALLSTMFFSMLPLTLFYTTHAMMDFSSLFWMLMSVYIYMIAHKTKKTKYFGLAGFAAALAALSKQMSGFVILFFLIHSIWKKEKLKNIIILLLFLTIPLIPYIIALTSVGGLEINELVAVKYAFTQHEPTQYLDPMLWIYYIYKAVLLEPIVLLFILCLVFYIYQKKPHWKQMLLWFSIFYILLTLIPNKEPRFFHFFMIPAYFTAGYYFAKFSEIKPKKISNVIIILFLVLFTAYSVAGLCAYWHQTPVKEMSSYIYNTVPDNGRIFFASEFDDYSSSSGYMFYLASMDNDMKIITYRPCIFYNKTDQEKLDILKSNAIYYVVGKLNNSYANLEGLSKYLEPVDFGAEPKDGIMLYKFKQFKPSQKTCNYICLVEKEYCV